MSRLDLATSAGKDAVSLVLLATPGYIRAFSQAIDPELHAHLTQPWRQA